ncbi:MAG TPA: SDR family NAD(P)-dependent oxidoreductase [Actinomycetota bacterium]|nr:SDR family NAD(P)-dependent oxidoreductase [Actinomycetota bacterium]
MRWNGSVAVVTGASRGIGRAVAREAAQRGARVGLIARSKDELEALAREIEGASIASADVAVRSEIEEAIGQIARELGPIDILVNNAGIGAYGPVADTEPDVFEQLIRVNYFGTVYATKAVLPSMLDRGRGHIVNVSSIAGRIGAPLEAAYSASKFAVAGLTEALAMEVARRGIGVSMVDPGPVRTSFFDARGVPYQMKMPRPVSPESVARRVVKAVEGNILEQYVPRWLRFPVILKTLVPPLYRSGTLRQFKDKLGD